MRRAGSQAASVVTFPAGTDRSPVPPTRQTTWFSCGAAALRSILKYWDVFRGPEHVLIDRLDTTWKTGTRAVEIVRVAREFGLDARRRCGMSMDALAGYVQGGVPVMCAIQAHGTPDLYRAVCAGHWVTVVGVTARYVLFQDSSVPGYRGVLPVGVFCERWRDWEWRDRQLGRVSVRLGIPVAADWKPVKFNRTVGKILP